MAVVTKLSGEAVARERVASFQQAVQRGSGGGQQAGGVSHGPRPGMGSGPRPALDGSAGPGTVPLLRPGDGGSRAPGAAVAVTGTRDHVRAGQRRHYGPAFSGSRPGADFGTGRARRVPGVQRKAGRIGTACGTIIN